METAHSEIKKHSEILSRFSKSLDVGDADIKFTVTLINNEVHIVDGQILHQLIRQISHDYRVLTTPSGAGLADINSMGPNGKVFTETTATQTCKSFQKGARPNSYKHHFDISSTNRPPRS